MSVVTISQLKSKYQDGDFPTESDFIDLIDTLQASTTISSLLGATATNTIDNTNYLQKWNWSTMTNGGGLFMELTSSGQTTGAYLLRLLNSGSSSAGGQTVYSLIITNTHTGSTSTNIGVSISASGATNNYAIVVPAGLTGLGTATPSSTLDLVGSFQFVDGNEGAGKFLRSDLSGNANWYDLISTGTFTPTLTNTTNVSASSPNLCHYYKIDNHVHFWGSFSMDITTTLVQTVLNISLPIPSEFTLSTDCSGIGTAGGDIQSSTGFITADTALNEAKFVITGQVGVALYGYAFSFDYEIK